MPKPDKSDFAIKKQSGADGANGIGVAYRNVSFCTRILPISPT
jgi:hypothetical protein